MLNGAIVVTNPINGDILALVGGVDYQKVILIAQHKAKDKLDQALNLLFIKLPLMKATRQLVKYQISQEVLMMAQTKSGRQKTLVKTMKAT